PSLMPPRFIAAQPRHTRSTPLPYTTLFRSKGEERAAGDERRQPVAQAQPPLDPRAGVFDQLIDLGIEVGRRARRGVERRRQAPRDRKSTRLNSSHEWISYAVFCLKKKSNKT